MAAIRASGGKNCRAVLHGGRVAGRITRHEANRGDHPQNHETHAKQDKQPWELGANGCHGTGWPGSAVPPLHGVILAVPTWFGEVGSHATPTLFQCLRIRLGQIVAPRRAAGAGANRADGALHQRRKASRVRGRRAVRQERQHRPERAAVRTAHGGVRAHNVLLGVVKKKRRSSSEAPAPGDRAAGLRARPVGPPDRATAASAVRRHLVVRRALDVGGPGARVLRQVDRQARGEPAVTGRVGRQSPERVEARVEGIPGRRGAKNGRAVTGNGAAPPLGAPLRVHRRARVRRDPARFSVPMTTTLCRLRPRSGAMSLDEGHARSTAGTPTAPSAPRATRTTSNAARRRGHQSPSPGYGWTEPPTSGVTAPNEQERAGLSRQRRTQPHRPF
jgi:hypothetical protein